VVSFPIDSYGTLSTISYVRCTLPLGSAYFYWTMRYIWGFMLQCMNYICLPWSISTGICPRHKDSFNSLIAFPHFGHAMLLNNLLSCRKRQFCLCLEKGRPWTTPTAPLLDTAGQVLKTSLANYPSFVTPPGTSTQILQMMSYLHCYVINVTRTSARSPLPAQTQHSLLFFYLASATPESIRSHFPLGNIAANP
jgi:hypothetical protein